MRNYWGNWNRWCSIQHKHLLVSLFLLLSLNKSFRTAMKISAEILYHFGYADENFFLHVLCTSVVVRSFLFLMFQQILILIYYSQSNFLSVNVFQPNSQSSIRSIILNISHCQFFNTACDLKAIIVIWALVVKKANLFSYCETFCLRGFESKYSFFTAIKAFTSAYFVVGLKGWFPFFAHANGFHKRHLTASFIYLFSLAKKCIQLDHNMVVHP